MDLKQATQIVHFMRAHGVKILKTPELELELDPLPAVTLPYTDEISDDFEDDEDDQSLLWRGGMAPTIKRLD